MINGGNENDLKKCKEKFLAELIDEFLDDQGEDYIRSVLKFILTKRLDIVWDIVWDDEDPIVVLKNFLVTKHDDVVDDIDNLQVQVDDKEEEKKFLGEIINEIE